MPLDNETLKQVDEKLTSLKQTNPKQYELFNKSLNSSDPFIKNKVLTEFKANPLGYLDKYYANPKPKSTPNANTVKPNSFDDYYSSNKPMPTTGIYKGFDTFNTQTSKEVKDKLNNFYFLKAQDPTSPQLYSDIFKIKTLAKNSSNIGNSLTYKNFEKDVIGFLRSRNPELANPGEFLNKIKENPNNYSSLYKMGLEYSKITENTPAFNIESSRRLDLDLDQIIKHQDYDKPLVGKSGFKYSGEEVRNLKAVLPSLGKQLLQKSYEDYLQNDVGKAMKPYQDKLADIESRLNKAQDSIKKPTTKQEIDDYNKKLKPLYDEYKGLLNTFNEVDKSVKYGYEVLKNTWKNKSWEEKKVESYNDEIAQNLLIGSKNSFSELNDFNKRRVTIVNNMATKFGRAFKGLVSSDYQLSLDSVNPNMQDVVWHTGDFDKDGNPVMSNQMSYIGKDGSKSWNLGAVLEEGAFQTVNMLGVGKLTGLFAKTLAAGANVTRAANLAAKTGEKFKYVPKYTADKILKAGFETPAFIQNNKIASYVIGDHISLGARALTLPAVYTTTYGRTYGENINKFKTEAELKEYSRTSALIEGLTESIVPDVFYFNNLGISSLGKKLSPSLYKQVLGFVKDGASLTARKEALKTLMYTSGKVALNTFQEAIVEEGVNHWAMGKYEDYKEKQSGSYKKQQEGDFEWQESLATMSLSMLMGVKGNYQQYSQRYNYDFTKPESLAYHRYNVAINADLLKNDIATDNKLNTEQKTKMLEMVHKNELLLKQSMERIVIPDKKTLGKDEESTFLYFNALSEKTRLEEQLVKNGLSEKDKKKYDDMEKLVNQLDAKNNDWSQLNPEQREKKVWQWFREGITETNELDELEDSPSISYARLMARREAIDKLYEEEKINKKTYENYLDNLDKSEKKITKDGEAKVIKNLSRIDELTEKQLAILQQDVLFAKALANDNFESVKIKDLEINSEPFTSVKEVMNNLIPGLSAKISYVDSKGKEFTDVNTIVEEDVLVDVKTGKEIPKESTVLTAELFESKGKNFEVNQTELTNRLQTINRVLEQRTNERLEEEKKVLQEKFNEDLVAAEAWVKEVGKNLTETIPLEEWEIKIDEYVKTIENPESANLIKERLLHKANEILNGEEEKTPVTQTETTTEDDSYLNTLTTPESINNEIQRLKKELPTKRLRHEKRQIEDKIEKLQNKLKSTDVVDIDFVRNNIKEVNGKFRLTVTIEGKKVTLESPHETKEESITFFNQVILDGTYKDYLVAEETMIQKVMGAMKKDKDGTWVLFFPPSGKYVKGLVSASLDNPNDPNVNKPIENKEEAAKSIIEFIKEYPDLIQLINRGGMMAEGIQKDLDLRLTDEVPTEETKTTQEPVSDIEAKKADIERRRKKSIEQVEYSASHTSNFDSGLPAFYYFGEEIKQKKGYGDNPNEFTGTGMYSQKERKNFTREDLEKAKEWINTKYDTELKALEENQPVEEFTKTNIVDLKAERKKELDNLFKGNYGWSGWQNNKELLNSENALVLSRQLPSSTEKAKYLIEKYKEINAKYDALENTNKEESTIDKEVDKVLSLYKDLMKSGVVRYTDENENPC